MHHAQPACISGADRPDAVIATPIADQYMKAYKDFLMTLLTITSYRCKQ